MKDVSSKTKKAPKKRGRPPKVKKEPEDLISLLPITRDPTKVLNEKGLQERKDRLEEGQIDYPSERVSQRVLRKMMKTYNKFNEEMNQSILALECEYFF